MDPISALGVAAAAVQFADYSGTVVKRLIDVYRFIDSGGSIEEFQVLKGDADKLLTLNQRLKGSLDRNKLRRPRTATEDDLLTIANECIDIGSKLSESLRELDVEKGRSKLETLRTAIKAVANKQKLESLRQRLAGLQQQLMSFILLSFR
jgi:hypothetical protein